MLDANEENVDKESSVIPPQILRTIQFAIDGTGQNQYLEYPSKVIDVIINSKQDAANRKYVETLRYLKLSTGF